MTFGNASSLTPTTEELIDYWVVCWAVGGATGGGDEEWMIGVILTLLAEVTALGKGSTKSVFYIITVT